MSQTRLSDISALLTESDVSEAFRRSTGSDEEVNNIVVTSAAPPGEGLMGAVYRITANSANHSASFVAKGLVPDELLKKTLNCSLLFQREAYFYEIILPALIEVQKSTGAKENIQNCIPVFYGAVRDGVNDYMLLEDLADSGCSIINGRDGFTNAQIASALRTLAHYHATSLALRALRPEELERIAVPITPEIYYKEDNDDWYRPFLNKTIEVNLEALAKYESPDTSIYWKKFYRVVSGDLYNEISKLAKTQPERSVIANGDAWAPNFMFSDERVVLIDYQICRFKPVAFDLMYFLFTCCDHRLTKTAFDLAIDSYYDDLGYFLRDMKLDIDVVYPRALFDEDLKRWGRFGFLTSLSTVPLMVGEQRCDIRQTFSKTFPGCERIPLERLWPLKPYAEDHHRLKIVNAIRVAVDSEFI